MRPLKIILENIFDEIDSVSSIDPVDAILGCNDEPDENLFNAIWNCVNPKACKYYGFTKVSNKIYKEGNLDENKIYLLKYPSANDALVVAIIRRPRPSYVDKVASTYSGEGITLTSDRRGIKLDWAWIMRYPSIPKRTIKNIKPEIYEIPDSYGKKLSDRLNES